MKTDRLDVMQLHGGIPEQIEGSDIVEVLKENVETAMLGPLPPDIYTGAKRRLDEAGMKPAHST